MKILIYMVRWKGGVGEFIRNITPIIESEGHEVKIISREDDLRGFSWFNGLLRMNRYAKKHKFDIIYSQDWSCALPFLFFKNNFCFYHGKTTGLHYLCQKFVSKFLKGRLITADLVNSYLFNCPLVPHGIKMDKFKPLKLKRKYLGWPHKGTETITKKEIEAVGKKVNMPVLIAENIPPTEMNNYYNKCKVFISLPPKNAGCQLSYLEPMAAGVPKIVGNINGEGLKYPFEKVEDFDSLAEAVKKSKKRDYRKWLEHSGITLENHVKKTLKIFNEGK